MFLMKKTLQIPTLSLTLIFLATFNVKAQSICDIQLVELKKSHLLAKYEQMPEEQKGNFFASLSPEQRAYLQGANAGLALGKAINPNYSETRLDKFNRELEKFKKQCGFMLQ